MMQKYVLSNQETAAFCRNLALLLQAGVGLGDGIYLMAEDDSVADQELLKRMGQQLDQGGSLSRTMVACGCFPAYVTGMVQVGERTGRLEEALFGLAAYYEERCRVSRLVRSALLYPSMILLIMLLVIGVLLIKVLPIFDQVYGSLGSGLTGIAEWLLRLGWGLKNSLPVLAVGLVVVVVGGILISLREDVRSKVIHVWNRAFGDKGISAAFQNARFAQALSMGMNSGMMLEEAVELARILMENVPDAARRCKKCEEMIRKGSSLTDALSANGLMSKASCRMLKVGMAGGNGDQVMAQIAKNMMGEAEAALEDAVAKAEPTMVLGASVLVGIILLAVMIPLANIMASIG